MKEFKNSCYYLTVVTLLLIVVAVTIAMVFGWRFVYDPELENSWNAISAVAAWAGAAASFIAIWFAIQVPKKIAEQQNKISLFEKRYLCYLAVQDLLAFSNQIEGYCTKQKIQAAFKMYFSNPEIFHEDELAVGLALKLNRKKTLIISGDFLFSNYDSDMLQNIIDTGIDLIMEVATDTEEEAQALLSDKADHLKTTYCALCKDFETHYLAVMENEMNLTTK